MVFDTHAHYDDKKFKGEAIDIIASLPLHGVCNVLLPGCDVETSKECIKLCENFDYAYAAVGFQPGEINEKTNIKDLEKIEELAKHKKVKAIGEIGLEYYYGKEFAEKQKLFLKEQLLMAQRLDLPVIIHDREAHEDTLNLLSNYKGTGVIHCYSGSAELAKRFLKLGFYISFTGVLTFNNARKAVEAAKEIPIERIMIETDSPYMAPVPYRGKRCDSRMVIEVAKKLAEIKNMPLSEVERITTENGKKLFRID